MATKTNSNINGYKYYRLQKTIGHKYVDGKKVPIKKSFYGTSKTNAMQKYEYWKEHKDDEIITVDRTRTVQDLAEEFNKEFELDSSYAYGTKETYMSTAKTHLFDSDISDLPIQDINHNVIQQHYINMKITKSALITYNNYIKLFFKWLAKNKYCDNVMKDVFLPEKKVVKRSEKIVVWEPSEITRIESELKGHIHYPVILLGLYAGLRISEIIGLKWSDIYDDQIHVTRQIYKGRIKAPKYDSYRNIPIHRKIKEALENYPHTSEYIFVTSNNANQTYQGLNQSLDNAYKRHGIKRKKFHAYRSTFCTNLCRAKVPIEVASKLLGHKNIGVTAEHYALVKDDVKIDAISRL